MWTVSTATASTSGSSSAVAGSSPASISVWRWRARKTARSSASERRLRPHDLEEAGDVRERLLGGDGVGARRDEPAARCRAGTRRGPRRPAARGRASSSARRSATSAMDRRPRLRARGAGSRAGARAPSRTAQTERLRRRAMFTIAVEVLAAEPVDLGGRERVEVDARVRVGDDAQERQQEPDLRPGVEARTCPENRHGMPGHVERAQERVGVAVRADEDRVVPRRGARRRSGAPISAAIQSASSDPVANASRRTGGGVGVAALGAEPLADPGADLEPVRVVEPDQPIGGVEDRRARAVVPAQDDRPRPAVPLAELEDVVDRRAAERVDRLVVVADDGHVAVPLGEQARPARPGRGSCPGTRRRGRTGTGRRSPRAPPATRARGAARARPGRRSRCSRSRRAAPGSARTRGPARPGDAASSAAAAAASAVGIGSSAPARHGSVSAAASAPTRSACAA